MTHLDLLLPFALPPAELSRDLLRQLALPALATLLARGAASSLAADPYARLLPHQQWLLGREETGLAQSGIARSAMLALGLKPGDGKWFVLHPCHFHIARDHLVLTDLRKLDLHTAEAHLLFDAARPVFADAGLELVYGEPQLWFLHAPAWAGLETSAPDAAVGHNVDIWMPRGPGERDWRRLHNEVQMLWHTLEVNADREARGAKAVNALWCWDAASDAAQAGRTAAPAAALPAFLPTPAKAWQAELPTLLQARTPALAVIDEMSSPALAGDWGAWLEAMQTVESDWFRPLLEAMNQGRVGSLNIVASDHERLASVRCSRLGLKKFWIRPTLALLGAAGTTQNTQASPA